jgi:hypothetical protein
MYTQGNFGIGSLAWIPACAGMTLQVFDHFPSLEKKLTPMNLQPQISFANVVTLQ